MCTAGHSKCRAPTRASLGVHSWSGCLVVFFLWNVDIVQQREATDRIGFQINWSNKKRLNVRDTFSYREKGSEGTSVTITIHLLREQVYRFSFSTEEEGKAEHVFKLQPRWACCIKKRTILKRTLTRNQNLKGIFEPFKTKAKGWLKY